MSPGLDWILLRHDEKTEHFSTAARYTLQEITSRYSQENMRISNNYVCRRSSSPLIQLGVDDLSVWAPQEYLQHASWVPGSSNSLILVKNNDIFYKTHPTASKVERITFDGHREEIFNGVTDWLYGGR